MLLATGLFVLVVGAVVGALWHALGRRVAIVISMWLAFLALFAGSGALGDFDARPPRMFLVLPPALIAVVVASRRLSFDAIPRSWPVLLETMRVPIELVLYLAFVNGRIPEHMTFAGRNFDVLVGLSAPLVAWAIAKGRLGRIGVIAWNVASLALLTNIVILAVTAIPGPLQRAWPGPPNTIVTTFPFVWLPGFLVPVALFGHLVSLRELGSIRATFGS